jgi:hypothetical protein
MREANNFGLSSVAQTSVLERNAAFVVLEPTATIGDVTMVDAPTTEHMAVDPTPGESEAPMMGNPVLMRGTGGRTRRTSSAGVGRPATGAKGGRAGWAVALPVAAVVIVAGGAAAYFFAKAPQNQPLTTNPPVASASSTPSEAGGPPPAQASTALPTAAPMAPTKTAPPPATHDAAAAPAAPRHEHATHLASAARMPARAAPHHAVASRARAADEEGADVSATAPATAPAHEAPAAPAAPAAPQVITPPPAQ